MGRARARDRSRLLASQERHHVLQTLLRARASTPTPALWQMQPLGFPGLFQLLSNTPPLPGTGSRPGCSTEACRRCCWWWWRCGAHKQWVLRQYNNRPYPDGWYREPAKHRE